MKGLAVLGELLTVAFIMYSSKCSHICVYFIPTLGKQLLGEMIVIEISYIFRQN